jgi:hypothetical protein
LPDYRVGRLTNKMLSNKDFYTTAFRHLQVDVLASSVWRSAVPLKCKIFCWLAKQRRIPTNARRFRHRITDSAACLSCDQDEDVDHLLLTCPRALETWSFFNHFRSAPAPSGFLDLLLSYCRGVPEATVTTAIVWNIWKRRNNLVFNRADDPLAAIVRSCIEDVRLWAFRCSTTSSTALYNWCVSFDPP